MRTQGMIVTVLLISCLISGFLPSAGLGITGSRVNSADAAAVVAVTGVSLNKATTTVEAGETETLVATVAPAGATNQNVTWSSDNAAATVAASVVSGVSAGTAVITVTALDGGKTATCTVTVIADTEPITLSVSPVSGTVVTVPIVTVFVETNADRVNVNDVNVPMVNGKFSVAVSLDFMDLNLIAIDVHKGTETKAVVIDVVYKPKKVDIKLMIGIPTIWVDGVASSLEAAPIITNSRTLVPIRAIVESVGGIINWDAAASRMDITVGRDNVVLVVGNNKAIRNGSTTRIDKNVNVVPVITNGRTLLPLRFVGEALEFQPIDWNAATKTIRLVYDGW